MTKRVYTIIVLLALVMVSCSSAPSESATQTDIAQTRVAQPTTTTSKPFNPTHTPTQVATITITAKPDTQTVTLPLEPTSAIILTMVSDKDGMVMVYIPAGKFAMGTKVERRTTTRNEQPQHDVYLDAFWIDQTEVTNAMYAKCVADGACQPPSKMESYIRSGYYENPQYAEYPVIYVSWDDADAYCRWAGKQIPTEAQWEKAARGDDGRLYPWGNQTPSCDLANSYNNEASSFCVGDTSQVGSYPKGASPYGALDMAGNIWEWVNDWYDSSYYSNSPSSNPAGPESGQYRVLRGGGWDLDWYLLRVASRNNYPDGRYNDIGFRCGVSPAP